MKVSEASEARQLSGRWLEKSGKHVGPDFTLKPNTKASSLLFCKTEIKTDIGGKKKRNKRRVYGLLVNGRDLRHYTKHSLRGRRKKGRGEGEREKGRERLL